MIRKILTILVIAAVAVIVIFIAFKPSGESENLFTVAAQRGPFESLVYSSGQLEAVEADLIPVPAIFRDPRIRPQQLVIADMIDEGTHVDSGDYVATLDHKDLDDVYQSAKDDLERTYTELQDSEIDSNLTLSNQRDQIVNARLDLEGKKIVIDESKFEAPSVIRKAEMDYEKAQRKLEQTREAYRLKQKQEANKVARAKINYKQVKERVNLFDDAYKALIIKAPKTGVIGYYRYSGGGGVVQATSTISPYSSAIATYPKMNSLVTTTYINEIDISKIKVGQKVTMGVDAFPEKKMYGEVINIANVGQMLPNSDAKVFEVKINIHGSDPDIKPSMTTSNVIQTGYIGDAVYVPLETVFKNDSLSYVYIEKSKGKKIIKQVIEPGLENENYVVVKQGVSEGDVLCLNEPENAGSIPFSGMDIYEKIKTEEKAQKAAASDKTQQTPPKNISSSPAGRSAVITN